MIRRFRQALLDDGLFFGCPVVWYELHRGLLARDAKAQMERFQALYRSFSWQDYTRDDWRLAATLWNQRRDQGLPIADSDLLIAAFARQRNAIVVTDNEKDFVGLQLAIENWLDNFLV